MATHPLTVCKPLYTVRPLWVCKDETPCSACMNAGWTQNSADLQAAKAGGELQAPFPVHQQDVSEIKHQNAEQASPREWMHTELWSKITCAANIDTAKSPNNKPALSTTEPNPSVHTLIWTWLSILFESMQSRFKLTRPKHAACMFPHLGRLRAANI